MIAETLAKNAGIEVVAPRAPRRDDCGPLAQGDRATELAVLHALARLAEAQDSGERAEELLFEILDVEQDLGDRLGRADTLDPARIPGLEARRSSDPEER